MRLRLMQEGDGVTLYCNDVIALYIDRDGIYRLYAGPDTLLRGLPTNEEPGGLARPVVNLASFVPPNWRGIPGMETAAYEGGSPCFLKLFPAHDYGAALMVTDSSGRGYFNALILGIRFSGVIDLVSEVPERLGFALDASGRVRLLS